jgi:hypothetical protein
LGRTRFETGWVSSRAHAAGSGSGESSRCTVGKASSGVVYAHGRLGKGMRCLFVDYSLRRFGVWFVELHGEVIEVVVAKCGSILCDHDRFKINNNLQTEGIKEVVEIRL